MAQAPDYSDLEVGRSPEKPKESYSTLQVNEADLRPDTHKYLARSFDPYGASAPERVDFDGDEGSHNTILGLRRKTFWIILILSLVVLAAIVGGAVGGTVGRHHKNKASSPSPNGTSSEPATVTPSAGKLLESTTLSSAAWNDTQGTLQQRLYVQANNNNIWELSWNSSTSVWLTSSESLGQAKSGSPLAAAVAYKGRTDHLDLYYINTSGELMQMNTTDYKHWDTNPVVTASGATIKPANDTSLAATWYSYPPCPDCSYNVFVAYQNSQSGQFEIVNSSMSGDVQYTTIPGNPAKGSSSTFDLQWRSNNMANIRLGYQLESGQIASAAWNGTINTWRAYEDVKSTAVYSQLALGAPMTSFNLGAGAPLEVPNYLFVLSAGENGVAVSWWDNSNPGFTTTHWGTVQTPIAMERVKPLSPIAANGAGHVFALEDGMVKEFKVEADGTTWDLVRNVTGR